MPDTAVPFALESTEDSIPLLALRPRQAAKALGIGTRLLWTLTNRGEVPHLKVGRCVLYPSDQLKAWLAAQAAKQ